MQRSSMLRIIIPLVVIVSLLIFTLTNHVEEREAYASDNQLIDRIEKLLDGQSQMKSELILIKAELNNIKKDLKEIKQKIEAK